MHRSLVVLAALAACRSTASDAVAHAAPGRLEPFKALAGSWEAVGGSAVGSRNSYRVTAGGSAVLETVFEGSDHEMVTLYHEDRGDLVLTHYCAAGNQPTMRALRDGDPKRIRFACVGGRNMKESDGHMHRAEWTFIDADHVRSEWTFVRDGKPEADAPFVMELERRPSVLP